MSDSQEQSINNPDSESVAASGQAETSTLEFSTAESSPVQSPEKTPAESPKKVHLRIHIPQEQYSNINFIALLVGYRGNTLKRIERESSTTVTVLEDASNENLASKNGNEKFYVLVKGDSDDNVKDCVELILKVFETAIKGRGGQIKLTRQQLLKMTRLDPNYVRPICPTCGAVATLEHNISDCQQNHVIPGVLLCELCKSSDHIAAGNIDIK